MAAAAAAASASALARGRRGWAGPSGFGPYTADSNSAFSQYYYSLYRSGIRARQPAALEATTTLRLVDGETLQ